MRATYYISFDELTWTRFYPTNSPVIKLQAEPGEIFKRWKVDQFRIGKKLNSDLYLSLMGMFFDPEFFGTEINYRVDVNGVPKYYFKDTIRAGKLNTQNKVYECTPDPDDDYEPILRYYNKKYDNPSLLFGLAQTLYYPSLCTTAFINDATYPFSYFSDYSSAISYTHDGDPAGPNVAINPIPTPADGNKITIIISDLVKGTEIIRLQLIDESGNTCSDYAEITANGSYEITMSGVEPEVYLRLMVINLTGSSRSGSFSYQVYLPTSVLNGATLRSLLTRILTHSDYFDLSVATVQSTIIWNDPLGSDPPPAISTYITANPTHDYVLEDDAILNNLYICRVDAFGVEEENIEVCLKDIMDILKSKRLWWFIDEDGRIRIEHDKYFRSYTTQVDLTSSTYAPQKPEVDKREYSYEGDNYNQINLIEENAVNEDFASIRINYDPLLTGNDVKDERISVTTDVKNAVEGGNVNNGLCLLRCDSDNNILWDESTITPGVYYPNLKLSPAWMSANYMDYFAEAEDGELVTGNHTFIHVKETLKQSGVKCRGFDLDWKKPLTLLIGEGWLSSAELDPDTGWYSLDVLYNPYEITPPETIIVTTNIIYGLLYNWYAATDAREICSTGWHVPTEAEWATLIAYLDGEYVAGGKLKETGTTYWESPNTDATNELQFNARGAGFRGYNDGLFYEIKITLAYWCSDSSDVCSDVILEYDSGNIYLTAGYGNEMYKKYGDSVRPMRDATEAEQLLDDGTVCDNYIGNDGKIYGTVKIGTQVWVSANLAETKYRDGTNIPNVTDAGAWAALTTGAYCAYDNNISNAYETTLSGSHTADSTLITADNTIITVDSDI